MTRDTSSDYRTASDLDGQWQFRLDPDEVGDADEWYSPDADWEDAVDLQVPGSWQEREEFREYTGTAWYRTTVEYDGDGDRAFLRFGAVDYEATVYVNGTEVGSHRDGYLPFEVEVTDAVEPGENAVVVEVFDPENLDEIPHGKQAEPWYTRVSGIWQSVTLEARPETFVTDVRATPDLDDDTVALSIDTDDAAASADAADVRIERDGNAVTETTCDLDGGSGECTLSIPDADYWTPDRPALYDVTVSLRAGDDVVDEYGDYFGMRSVGHDGDQFYLNGEPLYIRGALDQAYYPDTFYRPFDEDLFEQEIQLAKEMGFNMLRKHIKPAHPDFVEAADRLGILVWEEPANPTIYTDRSKREVRDQLYGMIDRDFNSPSVVIWSIYNEEWGIGLDQQDYSNHDERLWNDEEKQAYLTELFHDVNEYDPTRPVCDNSGWAHVATDVNDYHEYYVSPDRADAWEEGLADIVANPGDNYAVENTPAEDAPIVISEFGTWGLADVEKLRDHYGGDPTWFSHDFLDDPLKKPEGFDDRYEATNMPDVFEDYGDLAEVWQRREWDSVRDVIAEMRTCDDVAGYCITEFSDIEWEFNGMLDYFRDPKSFTDELPEVNDDLIVVVEPERHVAEPGETVTVDVSVVNDTNEPLEGTLSWEAPGTSGSADVSVGGFGTTLVAEDLAIDVPDDAANGPADVSVTFDTGDRTVETAEPLAVVGPGEADVDAVYAPDSLAGRLESGGLPVTDSLEEASVAVVQSLDDDVESFVEAGNAAVVVPGDDGRMAGDAVFEYRNLPAGESWNLVAALPYQDSDLVADLSPDQRIGWAFEDLFPHDLAVDLDADADEVHVGSVEGWMANWGSALVTRDVGDGRVCSCTFRVAEAYGDHPTATTLVDRLVETL